MVCVPASLVFISVVSFFIILSGVINVVTCKHEGSAEVGKALCESPKVAALSFTGSTRVGNYLRKNKKLI